MANIIDHQWIVNGTTHDEGWKIVTEDAYLGNEDDGYDITAGRKLRGFNP